MPAMQRFDIVPLADGLSARLAQLWVPWLKGVTGKDPEPEDLRAVGDPHAFYVAPGGAVFFALLGGEPVGVVALKNLSGGAYEFCKLVVTEKARGLGVGKRLVQTCIDCATQRDGHTLMLQSLRRLDVALEMYRRMGFVEMEPPAQMFVLARTEVVMGIDLR